MPLAVARAGLASHGLSLAHTHVRLNAAQLHNAARVRLGLADPPADASRRRVLLAAIGEALDAVQAEPVDFGALMAEQASAVRVMMTVAQIIKHVDGEAPVRFLIAETESGYTLLTAFWLARLFGIEKPHRDQPAVRNGRGAGTGRAGAGGGAALAALVRVSAGDGADVPAVRLLRQRALRGPARRFVPDRAAAAEGGGAAGQARADGRGGGGVRHRRREHRPRCASRLDVGPAEILFAQRQPAGVRRKRGSRCARSAPSRAATATCCSARLRWPRPRVARIAEHAFAAIPAVQDPIYAEPDFAADFFTTIGSGMRELVEDPGYAALLGAFGPALLDPTGSRPSARQSDSGGPATIRHPSELRAIPNNAILQQLGWCANTLEGLGAAAARHQEAFGPLLETSPRFRRAMDFAAHALAHSDMDVLRAVVGLVDPGAWLDRVAHTAVPGRAAALMSVARSLNRLGLWQPVTAMSRRIQMDWLALAGTWPDTPRMATAEVLLHALRIAAIQRIWLLGTEIPEFSPRHGLTRQALEDRLLRLDVPACLELLGEIFPTAPDPAAARDYAEPPGRLNAVSYGREHSMIFEPIGRLFAIVREIGAAITHSVGALG